MKGAFLRQAILLLGLAFVPAIGQVLYYGERISWNAATLAKDEVKLEDAQAWGESVLWVDARPDEQFQKDHIPGAISLNEDRWSELLPQMLAAWSPEKRVVVYCSSRSCAASHEVARRLRTEAELKEVFVLHGGWEKWLEAKK